MIKICEHIHDNGSTCGSPALTGYDFCYFHQRLRHPRHRPGDFEYKLPILDTPHAILMATQHITQAALDGILETSRARLVLSALRLAMAALKEMNKQNVGDTKNIAGERNDDVRESKDDKGKKVNAVKEEMNDVGTSVLARATRPQLAVPAEITGKAAPLTTASPSLSSRAPLLAEGSASCQEHRNTPDDRGRAGLQPRVAGVKEFGALAPVAPPKKPPLSATQLKLIKKIIRRGPAHPRFAAAARILDSQISRGKTE